MSEGSAQAPQALTITVSPEPSLNSTPETSSNLSPEEAAVAVASINADRDVAIAEIHADADQARLEAFSAEQVALINGQLEECRNLIETLRAENARLLLASSLPEPQAEMTEENSQTSLPSSELETLAEVATETAENLTPQFTSEETSETLTEVSLENAEGERVEVLTAESPAQGRVFVI